MCMNIHTNTFKDKLNTWEMTLSSASRLVWFVCVNNIHVCCMYMHSMCFMCMHAIHIAMILSNASRFVLFVRVKINMYTHVYVHTLIARTPPPRGSFLFTMFPHQEPGGRGSPSKHLEFFASASRNGSLPRLGVNLATQFARKLGWARASDRCSEHSKREYHKPRTHAIDKIEGWL